MYVNYVIIQSQYKKW